MLGYAMASLRARVSSCVAAFVVLALAAALVTACGLLLETGLRGTIETERYAAVPIVVAGDQHVHQTTTKKDGKTKQKSKALFERVWLPADTVGRVERVPGVEAAVAERTFPVSVIDDGSFVGGPNGAAAWGQTWDSAVLTPFTIVDGRSPTAPGEVTLDHELAERLGLAVGDAVDVQAGDVPAEYVVVGIAAADPGALAHQSSLFFSAEEAIALSGRPDQVSAIGVFAAPDTDLVALEADLDEALAGTAVAHAGVDRGPVEFLDAADARTRLISMGGAMAGTAVLVALLVVVGTFSISIRQRSRELALLRAVAATPRQLRRLIGREALIVALLAAVPGAAVGWALAGWLHSRLVDLGAVPDTLALAASPFPPIAAVVVTVAGAWFAARVSARQTVRIEPTQALSDAAAPSRLIRPGRLAAGAAALAVGIVLLAVLRVLDTEPASAPVTFLVVIVLSTAIAMLGPLLARLAVAVVGLPLRLSPVAGHLAVANTHAQAVRFAGVIAPLSLMIAMACTVAFVPATMTDAVTREARAGTNADLVIVSDGPGVAPGIADELRHRSDVTSVTQVVPTSVRVGLDRHGVQGVSPDGIEHTLDHDVTSGDMADLAPDAIAVSETTAHRHDLEVGDTIELTMGDGTPRSFDVVALYARGLAFGDLTMHHDVVAAHVDNPLSTSVLVTLATGSSSDELSAAIDRHPGLHVLDSDAADALRAERHRADAEVNYLVLGVIVVFTAIAAVNALAMSTAERSRELALLRLIGLTRGQVLRMLRLEVLIVAGTAIAAGSLVAVATLTVFSIGMTGTARPGIVPATYLAIVAVATLLAAGACLIPARATTRNRPERAIAADA